MRRSYAVLLVVLAIAVFSFAATRAADPPAGTRSDRDYLEQARGAVRELIREVERLQEDIIGELGEGKERKLYSQADTTLAVIVRFENALRPEVPRETLYQNFDQMDRQLHELIKAVRELGPEQRALQRAVGHVREADERLHYALFSGDKGKDRMQQLLERQAEGLAAAAQDLERTARYALVGAPGKGVVEAELRKLAEAAERFRKDAEGGASLDQLKKHFAAVNESWAKATMGMKELPPGENSYLLRSAGELDRLHDRLFRLLGMEGERPQLIIRT